MGNTVKSIPYASVDRQYLKLNKSESSRKGILLRDMEVNHQKLVKIV